MTLETVLRLLIHLLFLSILLDREAWHAAVHAVSRV